MRHRVKGRKLGRTASHRKTTLRSLTTSLLRHKRITTTLAKAKELRTFVEPLMTRAKIDSVAARRYVAREIKDREIVKELFGEIAEKIRERNGGYTRIVKLGQRVGDAAELAIIELVDYNEFESEKPKKATKKKEKVKEEEKIETFEEAAVEEANVIEETTEEPKEAETETTAEEATANAEVAEEATMVEEKAEETSEENVEIGKEEKEETEPKPEATGNKDESTEEKNSEEDKK